MQIHCSYDELIDIDLLQPNPKNPNQHPEKQLKLLAKIMNHQGWRHPITVSNRSGFIVAGHGRFEAARLLGWEKCPVDRQDFENEADEYAHMVADNKIAELAEHDDDMMKKELENLPKFDYELLGIPTLNLDINEKKESNEEEIDVVFAHKLEIDCLNEENQQIIKQEMEDRGFKVRLLL